MIKISHIFRFCLFLSWHFGFFLFVIYCLFCAGQDASGQHTWGPDHTWVYTFFLFVSSSSSSSFLGKKTFDRIIFSLTTLWDQSWILLSKNEYVEERTNSKWKWATVENSEKSRQVLESPETSGWQALKPWVARLTWQTQVLESHISESWENFGKPDCD